MALGLKFGFLKKSEKTPLLEMVVGSDKGRHFPVEGKQVKIGRGEENDIVLPIEGISRNHAVIERIANGRWLLKDNQSKNGVLINGKPMDHVILSHGDLIQLGNVAFRFSSQIAEAEKPQGPSELAVSNPYSEMSVKEMNEFSPKAEKPNKRVLIYAAVGLILVLFYLMQGETTPEKTESPSNSTADFKTSEVPDLSNSPPTQPVKAIEDPALSKAERDTEELDWANSSIKEAEQLFRRGQREYLTKNYGRAIELFQTTLSLSRGHALAGKYLRLAVYEAELEAKKHWELAVKYFDSLQYQRSIYHFSQVISLMAHRPSEAIVGQSEKYIAISKKRLQAAELFP